MPPRSFFMLDPTTAKHAVRNHLARSAETQRQAAETCADSVVELSRLVAETFSAGGKLLLCGNGGSAADCQHIAAEFVSTLNQNFFRSALPAIALTTDTSFLTANANDYGFRGIFARQVEALGRAGDMLIGITTSGNSENVVMALETARRSGLRTAVLTGANGGKAEASADVSVRVPSTVTQHIQEGHIAIAHVMCELVERSLFAAPAS